MIVGRISEDGVPVVMLTIAGREWPGIIDTGFNSDLELPVALRAAVRAQHHGRVYSTLAGGHEIREEAYLVQFPFDGEIVAAEATFVAGQEILIGTRLLRNHRLEIDFPAKTVRLTRV